MAEGGKRARLIAGPQALRDLGRLLRLRVAPDARSGFILERAVAHPPERIVLRLRGRRGPVSLYLKEASSGDAFVKTPHLGLALSGDAVEARAAAWLKRRAERLATVTLPQIFEILDRDPQTRRTPEAAPDASVEAGVTWGGLSAPAGSGAWSRFFDAHLDHETWEPNFTDARVVMVQHGDAECHFSHPLPDAQHYAFYNDPRRPVPRHARTRPAHHTGPSTVVSELRERDVVLGQTDDHAELLSAVVRLGDDARLFVLNHLCTPVVLGEDLAGLARRCSDASGRPVIPITRDDKENHDFFRRVLDVLGALDEQDAGSPRPEAVNLFCFPEPFRSEELQPWLEALGLSVEACVLPDVNTDALGRISRGSNNLLCAETRVGAALRQWVQALPQPTHEIPAAHGLVGSRDSLRAVASATARSDAFETVWARLHAEIEERWDGLTARSRQARLGLVVDGHTSAWLTEPARLGLPLLALLGDAGFDVTVLLASEGAIDVEAVRTDLSAHVPPDCPLRIMHATDEGSLRQALVDSGVHAVYSDYYFDWRLSSLGIGQFSLRHFEPGLRGAVRTVENLLAVCALPFYRRYARHLARLPGRWHV